MKSLQQTLRFDSLAVVISLARVHKADMSAAWVLLKAGMVPLRSLRLASCLVPLLSAQMAHLLVASRGIEHQDEMPPNTIATYKGPSTCSIAR